MTTLLNPRCLTFGALLLSLVLLVLVQPFDAGYADLRRTIARTLSIYWQDPTWQHGALAPLIAGWLVWRRREELAALPARGSAWGLALLLLSVLFYYAGFKANSFYFGAAAVQGFIAGAVLWVLGWSHARALFFPWLMLCFAWPLIFLEDTIAFRLRLVMVSGTVWLLNTLGVATLVDGTALLSAPNPEIGREAGAVFSLQVDGPCSGMRSLFALMMVSALFSYFRQPTVPRRLLLFVTSIPLAVLANLARLLILLAASATFGQDFAVGNEEKEVSTFHFLSGIAVFVVALTGLQGISSLMNRLLPRRVAQSIPAVCVPGVSPAGSPVSKMNLALTVRIALIPLSAVAAVLACRYSPPLIRERDSGVVMRLPGGVSRFLGQPGEASEVEKQLLPSDTEIVKMNYRTAAYGPGTQDQAEVTLVLAGAERRSIHRPEVCLTGQGWTLLDSRTVPVEIAPGRELRVRDLFIEKTVHFADGKPRLIRAHYLYWFVGTDVTTPSHLERVWLTAWDSVTRNVNHRWAYASVLALVTDNFTPEEIGQRARDSDQTLQMMLDLIRDLVPRIQKDFMSGSK